MPTPAAPESPTRPRAHVFYSWQSDSPNRTNRGFIEGALRGAIDKIHKQGELEVEPALDRDTMGASGSPDIAHTIFNKIDQAEVFVCDASVINRHAVDECGSRATPNPNVLLELGYAAKSLGWERVIVVVNTALGKLEELPFDIRARRILTYHFPEADKPAAAREVLTGKLADALSSILKQGTIRRASGPAPELRWIPPPPRPHRDHAPDIFGAPPAAPVEGGRLVLPAPLYRDQAAVLEYFDAEVARHAGQKPSLDAWSSVRAVSPASFRQRLADPAKLRDWYVLFHGRHGVVTAELELANEGTAPATDIDIRIKLPEWLVLVSHYRWYSLDHEYGDVDWPYFPYQHQGLSWQRPEPHPGDYVSRYEDRFLLEPDSPDSLHGTSPRLLHTYTLRARLPIALIAVPGAPPGPCHIDYETFCKELPARVHARLPLTIAPKPE